MLQKIQHRLQPAALLALSVEPARVVARLVKPDGGVSDAITLETTAEALAAHPAQTGAELHAALEAAGMKERRCAVTLPSSWALSAAADLPDVGAEDLQGYFELRAEREFAAADLHTAHSAYALPDGTRRATLAAIGAKPMETVTHLLQSAGLRPVSISLTLPDAADSPESMLHVLETNGRIELAVSTGGGIAAFRTISADPGAFPRELRITLGKLPESLRAGLRRARIAGANAPRWLEMLEKANFTVDADESVRPGGDAVAAALAWLHRRPVAFQFFTPPVNRWETLFARLSTRNGQRAALALAALILLPVITLGLRQFQESRLNAQWNRMKSGVEELDAIQQKIRQFRPWFTSAPHKLQVFNTVVTAFPDRGEVWTRSVQIGPLVEKAGAKGRNTLNTEGASVTVSGFSLDNAAAMKLQNTLGKQPGVRDLQVTQLIGSNPAQFSITFKWEPRP